MADGDRHARDQLQMGEHLKEEQVERMCGSVFSYRSPGTTRSIVCPEMDMGAYSVGGADVGQEGSCEDDGCGELDNVDIERCGRAGAIDECGDVRYGGGPPE